MNNKEQLSQIQKLLDQIKRQFQKIKAITAKKYKVPYSEMVYIIAKNRVGQDLSPTQSVLGCVESLATILKSAGVNLREKLSTYRLRPELDSDIKFRKTKHPSRGSIILSATGTQRWRTEVKNGHVGITGDDGVIYSNSSENDLWDDEWTIDKWEEYFSKKHGFLVEYYDIL